MMKNSLVKFLCFVVLLSTFAKSEQITNSKQHREKFQSQQREEISEPESDLLPNLWDDEVVNRMVREVLARDLAKENAQNLLRTRHRRDVSTSSTTRKVPAATQGSRKQSATPKASRKPVRQTQTNKNKNRVTQSTSITTTIGGAATHTTRATVKPTTIVASTTQFGNTNSLKIKVRSEKCGIVLSERTEQSLKV